jgi:SAM-dependent methyltransferase
MSIANRDQAEHWNGTAEADHWITHQASYDRMLAPFAEMILDQAAISTGDRVLDVGCGCGATTLAAAALATAGEAVGIDLSVAMLARARTNAQGAGLPNARFIAGDAQVHPFESASFDVVISRFGLMFFAHPVAAFANLREATKPGGRLVFVCWQPMTANQWLLVPGAALAEYVSRPDLGSPDAPGMFALADADRVRRILTDARWREIDVAAVPASIAIGGGGTLDDAVEFLRTGSMGRTLLAGTDPDTEARAVASVRAALSSHAGSQGVHLDAAVWLVRATA